MWWSRALVLLMVVALGPVGCGFRPMYAHSGAVPSSVAEELASVRVLAVEDRFGQQLRNNLVLALNPMGEPANPRYYLTILPMESMEGLAASQDGRSTVGRINVQANYVLADMRTGDQLFTGSSRSMGSFRYLGPRYASVASERDTEQSVLVDIADSIRGDLASWFANGKPPMPQARVRPAPQ